MTNPMFPPHSGEVDYSVPVEDEGAALARDQTPVRSMRPDDRKSVV